MPSFENGSNSAAVWTGSANVCIDFYAPTFLADSLKLVPLKEPDYFSVNLTVSKHQHTFYIIGLLKWPTLKTTQLLQKYIVEGVELKTDC